MVQPTDSITLRSVTSDNVNAIIKLSVTDTQDDFVAPNVKSLAEAFAAKDVWVRGIYAGEEPVGFVMLSDDESQPRYYLWRYMIDERYQGMGFGRRALEIVHDYVRTRPGGDRIFLSYVPADGGPEAFYKGLGYADTGVVHGGETEAMCRL